MRGRFTQVDWQTLFLDFGGRIGRRDFWIGFAVTGTALIAGLLLPVVGIPLALAALYCQVCVFAKRLHDAGRSGMTLFFPAIVAMLVGPAVAGWVGKTASAQELAMSLAGLVINGLYVAWVAAGRPNPGPNQYGLPRDADLLRLRSEPEG